MHPLLIPLHALERGEGDAFAELDVALKRYFRDIADQIQRLQDEVLALREQLTVALEAHLSLMRVRQNELAAQQGETIGRLTLVATVFLPLTFVTGFFGQNFGWLVSHTGSFTAFLISALAFLVVPCLVLGGWLVLRASQSRAAR
jgi:magnesium transporter